MKLLNLLMALILSVSNVYADTDGALNNFFSNLGFDAHSNSPSTYQSQAAGYATFGSIYARNRVRNIQIMHIDVPGFRSGCGGIDLFTGGFSFIKADQVVKFMQSVLSSGAGYALNLALEVELPEIAHALQYMQTLANKINSQNFNSCEMAEDLVGGMWPKSRASQQQICQDIGSHSGAFTDWAQARQGCSTGDKTDEKLDQAKNDPEYKNRVYKNTNIIWDKVIESNSFLSSDEKLGELYMTISGTVVFDKKGAVSPYPSRITDSNFIKAMLYGGNVPTYVCKDSGKGCVDVSFSQDTYQTISPKDALVSQVLRQLTDIYNRITNEEKLTDSELGMIAITQSPVFSMISANAQEGIGVDGLEPYAEMIATSLLSDYLNQALDIITSSLAGIELDQENIQNLFKSIQATRDYVDHFDEKTRQKFDSVLQTNLGINQLIQHSMSNLSPMFKEAVEEQA